MAPPHLRDSAPPHLRTSAISLSTIPKYTNLKPTYYLYIQSELKEHIMATKKQKPVQAVHKPKENHSYPKWLPWSLVLIGMLVYANTLGHLFALDDYSVIKDNFITKKGIAGISQLLTTDYRYGYWLSAGTLYRPLSLVLFAIEWQISPDNPMLFHLVNIMLYGLTIWMLFKFLLISLGKDKIWIIAATCFLFAIHPIHTEVVANVKSADEILGLLGGLSALYFYMKYLHHRNMTTMLLALLCYVVAVFSKESAVTFVAIFPLTAWFFGKQNLKSSIITALPFIIPVVLYLIARQAVIGNNLSLDTTSTLDNFLVGIKEPIPRFASTVLVLGYYLVGLLIPVLQCHELGYNQIPAVGLNDWRVWLTILAYGGMIFYIIKHWKAKDKVAYGFAFYLIGLSIVSNLVITIGTSYGERLMFMPSVGFILSITCLIFRLFKRLKLSTSVYEPVAVHKVFFGIVGALLIFKTLVRNPAWHDSYTLYKTDILQAPNSAKMRYHYALETGKLALKETDPAKQVQIRKDAIAEDDLSLQIFSGYNDVYSHKGLMYYAIKDYKNALENYTKAIALGDKDAKTFSNMGTLYSEMGQPDKAIENYRKAVQYDPRFVDARRNLGCMLAISKDFKQAIAEFQEALKYDPGNADILFFMGSAYKDMGDTKNAQIYLDQAYAIKPELKK